MILRLCDPMLSRSTLYHTIPSHPCTCTSISPIAHDNVLRKAPMPFFSFRALECASWTRSKLNLLARWSLSSLSHDRSIRERLGSAQDVPFPQLHSHPHFAFLTSTSHIAHRTSHFALPLLATRNSQLETRNSQDALGRMAHKDEC